MHSRLKHLRKDILKAKQVEMAKALGIDISTYSMIETGKRELKPRYVKVLVATYHVNEHWLKYGKGEEMLLSPKKKELLDEFERIDSEQVRMRFIRTAEAFYDVQEYVEEYEHRKVREEDLIG